MKNVKRNAERSCVFVLNRSKTDRLCQVVDFLTLSVSPGLQAARPPLLRQSPSERGLQRAEFFTRIQFSLQQNPSARTPTWLRAGSAAA